MLVSPPHLAALARAELPDRPWEALVPAGALPTPARVIHALAGPLPALDGAARTVRFPWRSHVRVGTLTTAGLIAGTAAFLLVPVLSVQEARPTLARSEIASRPKPMFRKTRAHVVRPHAPSRSGTHKGPTQPATREALRTQPGAGPAAGGGYVFKQGRFGVSTDGRYVTRFLIDVPCTHTELPRLEIAPTGTFAYEDAVGETHVDLEAGFVARRNATGTLQVQTPGCDSGPIPFTAHFIYRS